MRTKQIYNGQEIPKIGTQLRRRRVQLGLTQQELADRLGVTKGGLSAYEQDKISPSIDKLTGLADILGVSVEYLCGFEDTEAEEGVRIEIKEDDEDYKRLSGIVDRQMGIGKQIKELRIKSGLSSKELASRLGIQESVELKYERDIKYPPYSVLVKMAEELNVSTEELLGINSGRVLHIGSLSDENKRLVKDLVRSMK